MVDVVEPASADLIDLKKLLEIREPGYELDPLVRQPLRAVAEHFTNLRAQPGQQDDSALDKAKLALRQAQERETMRLRVDAEALFAKSKALEALDAARAAREDAVRAQAAALRAQSAFTRDDSEGTVAAVRDAAGALEDVRNNVDASLRHAEDGVIDEALGALKDLLDLATLAADYGRGAVELFNGGRLELSLAAAPIDPGEAVAGVLDYANRVRAKIVDVANRLDHAVTTRSLRETVASQDAAEAHRRVLDAEAAVELASGGAAHLPPPGDFDSSAAELKDFIDRNGLRAALDKLSRLIDRSGLSELQRVLLATEGVYEHVLLHLLKDQQSPAKETQGLRLAVLAEVDGAPRSFFLEQLLDEYRDTNDLNISDSRRARLLADLKERATDISLKPGKTGKEFDALVVDDRRSGNLPLFVERFASRGEIDQRRFTDDIKQSMADYLESLGLQQLIERKFVDGGYDEYFAQAYHFALYGDGRARKAPIRVVTPAESDFDMDTFELAEDQGVVKDHIVAAAALYEMNILGDQLGIFEVPTALMLRRARGRLDLSRGTGSQQLQEYKKYLRTAPLLAEDRQVLYNRVFGGGNGGGLEDSVSNQDFETVWDALMNSVGEYIRKTEANSSDLEDKISRGPVDESVRNLQYNLSFYATDIADDVRDMKEQFDMANAILQNPDIISSVVAGPRQNMWTVIERLLADDIHRSKSDDPRSINVAAMRTIGVEGYKILRYVAAFEGPTSEADFQAFVKTAEKWIIAKGSVSRQKPSDNSDQGDGFGDGFGDGTDTSNDSQSDWES